MEVLVEHLKNEFRRELKLHKNKQTENINRIQSHLIPADSSDQDFFLIWVFSWKEVFTWYSTHSYALPKNAFYVEKLVRK